VRATVRTASPVVGAAGLGEVLGQGLPAWAAGGWVGVVHRPGVAMGNLFCPAAITPSFFSRSYRPLVNH